MLSPEDDKYYRNYIDMFMSDGWAQFVKENNEIADTLQPRWAKDWEALVIMRTEIQIRENINNFEAFIREHFEKLSAPDEEVEPDDAYE